MRDLASVKRGSFLDKNGKAIPVTRITCLPANKYSKRYMGFSAKMVEKSVDGVKS